MRRFLIFPLILFLAACAVSPSGDLRPGLVVVTPSPVTLLPVIQNTPVPTDSATPVPTQATATPVQATPTPQPQTATATVTLFFTPTPAWTFTPTMTVGPTFDLVSTETPLPTLELPTQAAVEPLSRSFVGLPTYPGDSLPGWMFRLDYDPQVWAQAEDNFGEFVLAQRDIPGCLFTPWSGRGLPPDAQVEHDFREIGSYSFDVSKVSVGGELKFVAFVGGDKRVLTGFQVSFTQQAETCLADAEKLLLTFRPLAATPTPEANTPTPESSPTP